jgi:hypothetical protein
MPTSCAAYPVHQSDGWIVLEPDGGVGEFAPSAGLDLLFATVDGSSKKVS